MDVERNVALRQWIGLLRHAIKLSKTSIINAPHSAWFELSGGFAYSHVDNEFPKKYVADLQYNAPKPCLKPGPGRLPPPGEALPTEIKCRGLILCTAIIGDIVHIGYRDEEGKLFLVQMDSASNLEYEREVKIHDVPNFSRPIIYKYNRREALSTMDLGIKSIHAFRDYSV